MKKILYINHGLSEKCGVYDLGIRHFNSIKDIEEYNIKYFEINNLQNYFEICQNEKPDGIIFNHMNVTSPWINNKINDYKCVKFCVPHLFCKNKFIYNEDIYQDIYDYFIILDKNSEENYKNFKTNRPLPIFECQNIKNEIPNIGGFGFAFPDKNFNLIVKEVNNIFDEAIINFHMPNAHFNGGVNHIDYLMESCNQEITKKGIKINFNTKFLSQEELIKKINKNDLNCLFYNKNNYIGISSSLDYVIAAQKPILITESLMYRSFSDCLPKYPETNILEIFNNYEKYNKEIKNIYYNSVFEIKKQTKNILDKTIKR